MYDKLGKRFFDVLISFSLLIMLSPILLVVSVLLLVQNRGPILFFQNRPGKYTKSFAIIKFKTMTDLKNANGELLPDRMRITLLGRYIRKLSLDELPQLINVLKGDMSLIGPRPLLFQYIPLYSEEQIKRHDVRPGITGWAQVNGRNSISWTEKFIRDIEYIENMNFALDCKIVYLTIIKILSRRDVNQSNQITMDYFNGKN